MNRERPNPQVSAFDALGRQLVASLEVLHMTDRDAAVGMARRLVVVDFDEFLEGLEAVGAKALALDLHRAVARDRVRMWNPDGDAPACPDDLAQFHRER